METMEPGPETVRLLISAFGLPSFGGRLVPAARGSMGRIWRLELDDQQPIMIKQFFWGAADDAEEAARVEADLCCAARAAGLSLAAGIATTDGNHLVRLPDRLGGAVVRGYEWVDGRDLGPSDGGRADYLGNTLGVLHSLRRPATTQPDAYFTTPPDPGNWDELIKITESTQDRIGGLSDRLTDCVDLLTELGGLVDTAAQPDLITSHRDVKPGNVLLDPKTGDRTLVDWDEAGPIAPAREVAAQLWVWHVHHGSVDAEGIARTMAAYRSSGGHADLDDLSVFSLRLANDLNYIHGQVVAALADDITDDMRRYAVREAQTFLDNLPTRQILEQILDAAAAS